MPEVTSQKELIHDLANSITALDFLWYQLHRQYHFTSDEEKLGTEIFRRAREQMHSIMLQNDHSQ